MYRRTSYISDKLCAEGKLSVIDHRLYFDGVRALLHLRLTLTIYGSDAQKCHIDFGLNRKRNWEFSPFFVNRKFWNTF